MSNFELIELNYKKAIEGIDNNWFNYYNTYWYKYIIGLPKNIQYTYLIIILNNQVQNGGFHQYFVNGYGQFSNETINALIAIKAFDKSSLLSKALKYVNYENDNDIEFRSKILNKKITKLILTNDLFVPLDNLDSLFYSNEKEDLIVLLNEYLKYNP